MKAILFDAGLTLLRADPSLGGVYARVARAHGAEIPPGIFETAAEAAFHAQAAEHRAAGVEGLRTSDGHERTSWRRHAGRVAAAIPAMAPVDFDRWFEDLYDDFGSAAAWAPFDDALPLLREVRARGLRTAIVSNWDSRLARILEEHGLRPLFDAVVISAEVGWRKPHPEIFRRALEALGVAAADALHVGDSVGDDVEGARAVGIRPVLVDRHGRGSLPGIDVVGDLGGVARLLGGAPRTG